MNLVSIIGKNLGEIDEEIEWRSVEELAAIISSDSWAPGIFSERKRTIASFVRTDLLVLDVDDGCELSSAIELFATYKHVIATSRNHQKEKNGVTCDRFRVVLFLDSSISSDQDLKATWDTARKRFPFIDPACKDSSRFFYASPEVVSIKTSGLGYPVSVATTELARDKAVPEQRIASSEGPKGELWKSTLKFLLEGAPSGTRHAELIKAVGNMREQGYSHPEVLEKVETMSLSADWTQVGLNQADRKTIERMFNRDLKYSYQPQSNEVTSPSILVNAVDLLEECFAYLGDKDKVKGEPTGMSGLDTLLGGGFRTGELTVLMAQAKTGKNTLYHHLIYKHLERGIPFGYASRELNPATEVIPNLLSIALKSNAWQESINSAYQDRARQALSQWQLYFAPGYGQWDYAGIEAWFHALKDLGVNHILFDHFHYALPGEDYESTARLIKQLKTLTKTLDVHLSLIVQPRSLREGEALSLATLRGGAAIGQALDNLLILERVRGETNTSKLTLEVARHKLASLGAIYLQYDKATTAFEEVDRRLIVETPIPKGIGPRSWERQVQT